MAKSGRNITVMWSKLRRVAEAGMGKRRVSLAGADLKLKWLD